MPDNRPSYQVSSSFEKMSIAKGNQVLDFLKRRWWVVVAIIVMTVTISFFILNYIETRNQLTQLSQATAEAQKLVTEISVYLELPAETPTIATVSNASKLQNQEFFKKAQDGDKVLIFSNSGRALLYRPSTHKTIEYAKVDLGATPTQ